MSGESLRMLPAHATSISIKRHSSDPVSFAMAGRGIEPDGVTRFDEAAARAGGYGPVQATELVEMITK